MQSVGVQGSLERSLPLVLGAPPALGLKKRTRANREDGLDIVPITVKELLDHERVAV